jgi:hypothetical protein
MIEIKTRKKAGDLKNFLKIIKLNHKNKFRYSTQMDGQIFLTGCFWLRIQSVIATLYTECVSRRSVGHETETSNLLHGESEGADVGALETRRLSSNDRTDV